VAGESFHPYGGQHQIDLERGRRYLRGVVAPQCIRIVPLSLANPRRIARQLNEPQREDVPGTDGSQCRNLASHRAHCSRATPAGAKSVQGLECRRGEQFDFGWMDFLERGKQCLELS